MELMDVGGNAGSQTWADLPGQAAALMAAAEPAAAVPPAPVKARLPAEQAVLVRCPQDQECPDGGFASRIFDCQEGCGFRGCSTCMEIHESEPHSGDSVTTLEMVRNAGRVS